MASLANTKWKWNNNLVGLPDSFEFNVNFFSYREQIRLTYNPNVGLTYYDEKENEPLLVYSISNGVGTWVSEDYKTIEILSGADIENETLNNILNQFATPITNATGVFKIKGVWKFKDKTVNGNIGPTIDSELNINQQVNFDLWEKSHWESYDVINFEYQTNNTFAFIWVDNDFGEDCSICGSGYGWSSLIKQTGAILDFGNTEQEVSEEFYNLMYTHAKQIQVTDYFTKVTGKWKWNDTITPIEADNTVDYTGFVANDSIWPSDVEIGWAGDYFGVVHLTTGIGFYLAGIGWLDGSVTLEQLLSGSQPVPGTQLQTWDFGDDGVWMHNDTNYKYFIENAKSTTKKIKGVWKFKDAILGNGVKGPAFAGVDIDITQEVNFKTYHGYSFYDYEKIRICGGEPYDGTGGHPYGTIYAYPDKNNTNTYFNNFTDADTWWKTYDLNGCYLDFGNTEQNVTQEFYEFMEEYAYQTTMEDVFRKATGKWKWNDTIEKLSEYIEKLGHYAYPMFSYRGVKANNISFDLTPIMIAEIDGIFGVIYYKTGDGLYLEGLGWLDGTVNYDQLMSGTQPILSDVLQTWDFGDGAWLTPIAYEYMQANANQIKTIKAGTYIFNDVLSISSADDDYYYEFVDFTYLINGKIVQCIAFDVEAGMASFIYQLKTPIEAGDYIMVYNALTKQWLNSDYKTITITEDTEVSVKFYEWFVENAEVSFPKCELKGKWVFKEKLNFPFPDESNDSIKIININFTIPKKPEYTFDIMVLRKLGQLKWITYYITPLEISVQVYLDGQESSVNPIYNHEWEEIEGINGKIIDFGDTEQEVSKEFYDWFTANAKPLQTLEELITNSINAIKEKKGIDRKINAQNIPDEISSIGVVEDYDGTIEILIKFTLFTEITCLKDMTWKNFAESKYNVNIEGNREYTVYIKESNEVVLRKNNNPASEIFVCYKTGEIALSEELIISNYTYDLIV